MQSSWLLNAPLTKPPQECADKSAADAARCSFGGQRPKTTVGGFEMDSEMLLAKTPATLDEIKHRVANALERHPLCRDVQFDIVGMPRSNRGGKNWTISLRTVAPDALWEASDIVADIQDAYELTGMA